MTGSTTPPLLAATALPPLFEARLRMQLARFCAVRRVALERAAALVALYGDEPAGAAEATALLRRRVPDATVLAATLERLEAAAAWTGLPAPGGADEDDLLDALSAVFVDPRSTQRALEAVRHALGEPLSETVFACLASTRAAHFDAETHPQRAVAPHALALAQRQPALERLLLDATDADRAHDLFTSREAFDDLRETLRESAARQAFLLRVSDTLRPLYDPAEVQVRAARALGEHLRANRCQYCEALADEDTLLWGPGYEEGVSHLEGHIRISDFDPSILRLFRGGGTLVIDDIHDQFREHERLVAFAGAQIRAALAVPLVKNGRLVAVLSLHHAGPRHWTPSQVQLAEEVAERTWAAVERARAEEALRQSEASLQEADRRKDEFLAILAHELRNPLAPIRNALQLLRIAPDRTSTQRVHGMLDRQVRHMVRLLDELLEISRISRGVIELRRRRVDLAAVIGDAVEASRPAIEYGRHLLDLQLPDEPVWVDGDAMRLAQVLSNLLNNAARYTDAGGLIALRLERVGDEARLQVRDNGIGIAPDQLAGVFSMFAQVDHAAPRSQGGLGIGLALARRLAQMHGGDVDAASDGPGRGSCFTLRLPLAGGSVEEDPPDTRRGLARARKRQRVLVVDDNRDAADSTAMLLGALGAEVDVAYDGEAGLASMQARPPEIVLLDLGMPGMDGWEVARRVRADASLAGVTLIAVTGWGQAADRQRTQEAGFDHHLVKPVEPQALQVLLETLGR
jgi:signal transduction histidine kinase/CheY-like chemotaxis protein